MKRVRIPEPWLYLGPALIWFLVFSAFPLVYTINMSVHDWGTADHIYVGLTNYAEMIGDRSRTIRCGRPWFSRSPRSACRSG